MTSVLFLVFVILIFISLGVVFTLEHRVDELLTTYDALRADVKMTLREIDNEVKLDPTDPDFSAGRTMGLRQAQHMFEAVLERDTRREKHGD